MSGGVPGLYPETRPIENQDIARDDQRPPGKQPSSDVLSSISNDRMDTIEFPVGTHDSFGLSGLVENHVIG